MLAGMDDKEDPEDLITMEAMSGRAKIFDQIDEGHVRPILINIALRITKRCTDIVYFCVACNFNSSLFVFICMSANTKCALRATAYTLFGSLSRFGNGHLRSLFWSRYRPTL